MFKKIEKIQEKEFYNKDCMDFKYFQILIRYNKM